MRARRSPAARRAGRGAPRAPAGPRVPTSSRRPVATSACPSGLTAGSTAIGCPEASAASNAARSVSSDAATSPRASCESPAAWSPSERNKWSSPTRSIPSRARDSASGRVVVPTSASRTSSLPRAADRSPGARSRPRGDRCPTRKVTGVEAGPALERRDVEVGLTRVRRQRRDPSFDRPELAGLERGTPLPAHEAGRHDRIVGPEGVGDGLPSHPRGVEPCGREGVELPALVGRQPRAEVVGEQPVHSEPGPSPSSGARNRFARSARSSTAAASLLPVIAARSGAVKRSATAAADRSSRRPASRPSITSSPR